MQEQKTQNQAKEKYGHTVRMENRKTIFMTGIQSVLGFSSQQIKLQTESGTLTLSGEGLKITSFNGSDQNFSATGKINGIKYGLSGGLKGLFK